MALVVYWYDFICFGIVGVAMFGALWVLWRREGGTKCEEKTMNESLLLSRPDTSDGYVRVTPRGHVSTSQLWSTCWVGLSPIWLFGLRLGSCGILCWFLAWDIELYDTSIFVYYTEWTFTLVIIYFAIGTVVSAYGCVIYYSRKAPSDDVEENSISTSTNFATPKVKEIGENIKFQSQYSEQEIAQRTGFWGYLMQTAYQTCAGAVILTDIVFWCIIVPFLSNAHYELNMIMGCMHTLNAVLLLLDTSLNCLSFPWFRLSYFVLWSCCYIIFQWVIHACGFIWWPYPFLELSTPWAPLWYFCLALVHIPCYGLYSLLVRAKNSIFPTLFPRVFVRL